MFLLEGIRVEGWCGGCWGKIVGVFCVKGVMGWGVKVIWVMVSGLGVKGRGEVVRNGRKG